jgi:hypothetical protein
MKIILIPALCQLPLIEASRSTIKDGAIQRERRPAGFLARLIAKVRQAIDSRAPVGYEDETGFHHGVAEVPPAIIRTSRIQNRLPVKTCLRARWQAVRTPNLNSGGRLVFQWDSPSLPPCQPSPEFFSTESNPRHLVETGKCPASFTRARRPTQRTG